MRESLHEFFFERGRYFITICDDFVEPHAGVDDFGIELLLIIDFKSSKPDILWFHFEINVNLSHFIFRRFELKIVSQNKEEFKYKK